MKLFRSSAVLALALLLLVACNAQEALPTFAPGASAPISNVQTPPPTPPITPVDDATAIATVEATSPASATAELQVTPTLAQQSSPEPVATAAQPAPEAWAIEAAAGVPAALRQAVQEVIDANPQQFQWVEEGEAEADVRLLLEGGEPLAQWVFAVAVPFATVDDGTSLAQMEQNWLNGGTPQAVASEAVQQWLAQKWGAGSATIVPAEELAAQLWEQRPAWGLVPFDELTPDLKVLAVDGQSPLQAGFEPQDWPFTAQVGLEGGSEATEAFLAAWEGPQTNYHPERMTRIAMTGVTALVRATAYQMEIRGILYPGEEVAPVMQEADIAHVSNEVSFVASCPTPHYIGDPVFCSDPRYMELLTHLGVDVVELTGNHLNDWGAQYLPYTLDLYDQAGMQYFGGGRDLASSQEPLLMEHNGNRIAFVGCNPVGPYGGWAMEQRAGSAPCDYDLLHAQIQQLSQEGHLVIATQQYSEYYHYEATAQQQADFRALAESGAAAVSGSQGHHAQGFDFHNGSFIHYGLGNLFFDQMDRLGTRQTFVDQYIVYDGRLISVELWTGLIENYARPRLMLPEERADLLQTVFQASGW